MTSLRRGLLVFALVVLNAALFRATPTAAREEESKACWCYFTPSGSCTGSCQTWYFAECQINFQCVLDCVGECN